MEKNLKMALARNDKPCTLIVDDVAYTVMIDTFTNEGGGRFHIVCREVGRTPYNTFYVTSNPRRSLPKAYIDYVEKTGTQYIDAWRERYKFQIERVIYNPPATIVFWKDGTKSVVKCREDDIFDPEKGLTMAIAKKVYGNKYDYYNTIRKWLKVWEKEFATPVDGGFITLNMDENIQAFKQAVLDHFGGKDEKKDEDI